MDMIWEVAYQQREAAIQEEHMPKTVALSQRFKRQKRSEELQVLRPSCALNFVGKTLEEAIKDISCPETTLNPSCLRQGSQLHW